MYKVSKPAKGVRIIGVETTGFKTGKITISMAVPMGENIAANALLIQLLRRSCNEYPEFSALNGKLDDLYGAALGCKVSKLGDAQILSISITYLDDKFSLNGEKISSECLELLAGMVFKPNCKNKSFGKENLDLEKRLMIQRIQELQDDKRTYAYNKCIEYLCENEYYGKCIYGTIEEVKNVRMADIYAAWKNILSTAVFQITAVGLDDIDGITELFAKHFSCIDRNPCKIKTKFKSTVKRVTRHEESVPVNQGKLVIGYRTGAKNSDDRHFEFVMANDIFGGGPYAKLFTVIREKMSLAYYCWSRFVSSKGLILIEAGIDTDKEKTTTEGIADQLKELCENPIPEDLLDSSRRSLKESTSLSTPEAYCGWYDSQILDKELLTPEEAREHIDAVTAEQVQDCLKTFKPATIFMLASQTEEAE